MPSPAMFEGRAVAELLDDGRRLKLTEPFAYIDAAALRWEVPAGATVDGASIPRALWTIVGGPLEGKYRNASIIHDWYCDLRSRPRRAVHRVFYEAMISSKVSALQARILYAGVLAGGPRWSETVVENVKQSQAAPQPIAFAPNGGSRGYAGPRVATVRTVRKVTEKKVSPFHYELEAADLDRLASRIKSGKLDLDAIDAMVETDVKPRTRHPYVARTPQPTAKAPKTTAKLPRKTAKAQGAAEKSQAPDAG
jgi:hypothetical protein